MIDREQLYKWWSVFQDNGNKLCEIRCLDGQRTYSGYYRSLDNIIRDIEPLSERPNLQIYFVLNTIKNDCYDRQQQERMVEKPKNTTSDNDIEGRNFILMDFDPERPSGVGSTEDQLKEAHNVAKNVYNFLIEQGFSSLIVCKSGNGVHCLAPIRLANTPENTKLVERFLKAIDMSFSTDMVHIDTKVANSARICKLYGTYAKKGANTVEHPWRLAKFWKCPDEITPNSREYIEKVANLYPEERPQPSKENNFGRGKFDIVDFFTRHNIEYRPVRIAGGTRYILKECPFDSSHKDPDSMVFQHDNGALSFVCYHNSCAQYGWREYRMRYEPDAYDKKDYLEFQHKQRYFSRYEPVPVEIKKENETDGKKWLSPKDIKRIKDDDFIAIPTGVYLLDTAIKGLILGEISILSGINASGKTSFINTLLLNAVQKGFVAGLWSGELQAPRLKGWIYQTAAGKANVVKVVGSEKAYETSDKVVPMIDEWLDKKLYIYNNNYGSKWKQLLADITECIDTLNAQFIVLDNLMAMSLDEIAGDKNEKQKQFISEIAELAKKKNVHVLVVAHPRKEINNSLLRKESISGSSDLTNVIDNLFLIHRVTQDFEKRASEFWGKEKTAELCLYDNVIEVAKNRAYGYVDYTVGLYYETETRRFKNNVSEYIHYGWEPDNGYQQYVGTTSNYMPINYGFSSQTQITDTHEYDVSGMWGDDTNDIPY